MLSDTILNAPARAAVPRRPRIARGPAVVHVALAHRRHGVRGRDWPRRAGGRQRRGLFVVQLHRTRPPSSGSAKLTIFMSVTQMGGVADCRLHSLRLRHARCAQSGDSRQGRNTRCTTTSAAGRRRAQGSAPEGPGGDGPQRHPLLGTTDIKIVASPSPMTEVASGELHYGKTPPLPPAGTAGLSRPRTPWRR